MSKFSLIRSVVRMIGTAGKARSHPPLAKGKESSQERLVPGTPNKKAEARKDRTVGEPEKASKAPSGGPKSHMGSTRCLSTPRPRKRGAQANEKAAHGVPSGGAPVVKEVARVGGAETDTGTLRGAAAGGNSLGGEETKKRGPFGGERPRSTISFYALGDTSGVGGVCWGVGTKGTRHLREPPLPDKYCPLYPSSLLLPAGDSPWKPDVGAP